MSVHKKILCAHATDMNTLDSLYQRALPENIGNTHKSLLRWFWRCTDPFSANSSLHDAWQLIDRAFLVCEVQQSSWTWRNVFQEDVCWWRESVLCSTRLYLRTSGCWCVCVLDPILWRSQWWLHAFLLPHKTGSIQELLSLVLFQWLRKQQHVPQCSMPAPLCFLSVFLYRCTIAWLG